MRTRAIGYVRVDDFPPLHGVDDSAQSDAIWAYSRSLDFDLVDIFFDSGDRSSNFSDCIGLQQSFAMIDSEQASALVVYKLDCLSPNVLDVIQIISKIVGYKASLHSIVEGLNTQSGLDLFFVNIASALNQLERSCVSNRTIHAMASKKMLGHHCGSPPYGYQVVDKKLRRDPAEARVIALISSMKADGATLQMIADELNFQGFTTKRNSKWQPTQVSRVLTSNSKAQ
ncbi:MAG: recombinase family protein [Pseudanabaena sp. M38BS1SP1A06MG]|nr:recombinase family protein [Pseudanabaena sp. M53BS1SP1A06MG]MCA6592830.1 recombinase family protein [Pseudanabaena sp. M38BS1SP1A06MG]